MHLLFFVFVGICPCMVLLVVCGLLFFSLLFETRVHTSRRCQGRKRWHRRLSVARRFERDRPLSTAVSRVAFICAGENTHAIGGLTHLRVLKRLNEDLRPSNPPASPVFCFRDPAIAY